MDHRQEWVAKRLRAIAELFAIDVTDFAVIDNEFHAVLRNRPDLAAQLSDEQVIRRWFRMSRRGLNLLEEMGPKKLKYWLSQRKKVAEFRRRLSSISWLMIMLKEPIARAANAEDKVRGHFFGERFSSVELKDGEQRLVTSLQINSLPVRVGLAKDLASSRFTAAHERRRGDGDWLAGEQHTEGLDGNRPADATNGSSLFNRLPFDVYVDWLESNLAPAGADAALKTAALGIPVELPAAWSRYGLDVARWSEAVEIIALRFRWLAFIAASMRYDCRRFVADSGPPAQ